jgi:hypothetical protein
MKKKIFTSIFAIAIGLIATVMNVIAQDADNPWHLIVTDKDNKEVAAFNVETLDNVSLSAGNVKVDMTWDNKSQSYSYPIETTTFGFDPRANGTGTANEVIAAEKWSVYYNNGTLHVSKPVGPVAIYAISGILIGQYPNQSQIPVNLNQGLYIVQAGNKSAKLLVSNGYGGTTVQPVTVQPVLKASPPPEINLRAGGGIKIYWNITTGNSVVPVEISEVVNFKFTADNSIVFSLKNGITVELENYQGIEFFIEPVPVINSKWNMELTMRFGGAALGVNKGFPYGNWATTFISVFTNTEIRIYDVSGKKEYSYPISFIPNIQARVSMSWIGNNVLKPGYSFYDTSMTNPAITFLDLESGNVFAGIVAFNFDAKTNLVESTLTIESGDLKVIFGNEEYIFKKK